MSYTVQITCDANSGVWALKGDWEWHFAYTNRLEVDLPQNAGSETYRKHVFRFSSPLPGANESWIFAWNCLFQNGLFKKMRDSLVGFLEIQ